MAFKQQFLLSLVIRSFGLGLGFLVSIIIARYLGVSSLGNYSLFIVHAMLLLVLAKVGQDTLLLREGARLESQGQRLSLFKASMPRMLPPLLFAILLYTVLTLVGVNPLAQNLPIVFVLLMMLATLGGQVTIKQVIAYLRSNGQTSLANIFDGPLLNLILILSVIGALFVGIKDQGGLAIGAYTATGLGLCVIMFGYFLTSPNSVQANKPDTYRLSYRAGLPFLFISASTTLNSSIDTLSISYFLSEVEVGLYSAPLKLSALVSFPLVIAATVVSNQFSRLYHKGDIAQLKALFVKVVLAVGGLSGIIFVCFILVGPWLLGVWSAEFVATTSILYVLCFAQLINAMFGPVGMILSMANQEKTALLVTASAVLINIALNAVLIRWYGILGAAIATATVVILQNIGFYLFVRKLVWKQGF